jgi:hypothetical protein
MNGLFILIWNTQKNKNTVTYLTEKDVSYKINDEINSDQAAPSNIRNQSANLPKRTNSIVRNEVDEFLKKYQNMVSCLRISFKIPM